MKYSIEGQTPDGFDFTIEQDESLPPDKIVAFMTELSSELALAGCKPRWRKQYRGGGGGGGTQFDAFWVEDLRYACVRLYWPEFAPENLRKKLVDLGKEINRSGVVEWHSFWKKDGEQKYVTFEDGELKHIDNPLPSDIPPYTHFMISLQHFSEYAEKHELIRQIWSGEPLQYDGKGAFPKPDKMSWQQPEMKGIEQEQYDKMLDWALDKLYEGMKPVCTEEELDLYEEDARMAAREFVATAATQFDIKQEFTEQQKKAASSMLKRHVDKFLSAIDGNDRRL